MDWATCLKSDANNTTPALLGDGPNKTADNFLHTRSIAITQIHLSALICFHLLN